MGNSNALFNKMLADLSCTKNLEKCYHDIHEKGGIKTKYYRPTYELSVLCSVIKKLFSNMISAALYSNQVKEQDSGLDIQLLVIHVLVIELQTTPKSLIKWWKNMR